MTLLGIILQIVALVANWFVFKKMGREGWEGIIPIYNLYVLFQVLYGNGWKFLLLLIPFYNIYLAIKLDIDLAHAFNKSTGFGIGLLFFPFIFNCILAFSADIVWKDGSYANTRSDFVSNAADTIAGSTRKDAQALDKLKELKGLYDAGILTEEEYAAKKAELLNRV